MKEELEVIKSNDLTSCFLTAEKTVFLIKENGGMVSSRGNIGASFVEFLLRITKINPLSPHYVCPVCKHIEYIDDLTIQSGFDLQEKNCPACNAKFKGDGHNIDFENFMQHNSDKTSNIYLNYPAIMEDEILPFLKRFENVKIGGLLNPDIVADSTQQNNTASNVNYLGNNPLEMLYKLQKETTVSYNDIDISSSEIHSLLKM